ncbi:hypothetical protein [Streptomyces anulatus]|uniref:hypothetical protein n=1 Tax=Streptomyces anulatus TaxID=1892 RepID=UPI0037DC6F1E|nr:hypothetical protein OHB50_38940 [Streptomyces anulatus]
MPVNSSASVHLYPSLTVWGYTDSSDPRAPRPAPWELARLAVQAGHFLAMHTRRPEPSPEPPKGAPGGALVHDGWVNFRGWQQIVPCPAAQAPGPVDPELVARRMTSSPSATATNLRQLFERTARALRYPDDLPDGVALTIGAPMLTDEWWGYVRSGWLATLTGAGVQSAVRPLPEVPDGWPARYLKEAMEWMTTQSDLDEVRHAFHQMQPRTARDAVALLGYDRADLPDREMRTVLARLLSLYAGALTRGDQEVIGLVRDLCRAAEGARLA